MRIGSLWTILKGYTKYHQFLGASIVVTVVAGLSFSPYIPFNVNLAPQDVAPDTIFSPHYLEFETQNDKEKTEELRKRRAALVEKIYTVDEAVNKDIRSNTVALFTEIRVYQQTGKLGADSLLKTLNKSEKERLREADKKALDVLENLTAELIEKVLRNGVRDVDASAIQARAKDEFSPLKLDVKTERLIVKVTTLLVRPNLSYNPALTKKAQDREISNIKPIVTIVKEGEPIIYRGEVVKDSHIEILRALHMYGQKTNIYKFIGVWLLCAILAWILFKFSALFNPKSLQPKYLIFTAMSVIVITILARLLQEITVLPAILKLYFLIPLPVAALLFSQMLNTTSALMICTQLAIVLGIMYFGDLYLTFFLFCSSCVTTFSIYKRYARSQLMLSGYVIGAAHAILILTYGLLRDILDPWWFLANMGLGCLTGVVSAMMVLAIIPYLESLFKITTHQTLLELSNLNHPLLKRLMMTAPGTYQHSLMVANLAEAAAEAIQADPVLCRVGAYYHDIGKIKRPQFFTENQFSGQNPHATLNPRMSKMIIAAHTREGVELATKYKLPAVLKSFIVEHHGTSMVSFFFSQAMYHENVQDTESEKEAFRYPGPKPHFKESGIVMLADSVEAAIRAMDKPSISKIEVTIEKIFQDKIQDGQLDNCPISLREIEMIKATFLRVFHGIYHSRLDYQEAIDAMTQHTKGSKRL